MQKAAPSIGRILVAVGFALSCFGLLLFLWVAFGGPVPLKAKSYRVTVFFPEATQLAIESDVRIGGVSVGKVKTIELAPIDRRTEEGADMTETVVEIEPEFAPISTDARAMLRQKTLLGETYVELTSGSEPGAPVSLGASAHVSDADRAAAEPVPEGGELGIGQVRNQTGIDEIFNALDEETRRSFQRWQQNAAVAIQDRGMDLNDAFGNLGPFLSDASDTLAILRRQKAALKGLVRDTGVVFEALTEQEAALAGAITNSNEAFGALASEEAALRDLFQVFPTFQRETRATLIRLDAFQADTLPLVQDLKPVADDLTPTLRSVRRLSPPLRRLFGNLDELIDVSRRGLPDLATFLDELAPVMDSLDPFLANLNPVINYLEFFKTSATDFLSSPPAGLSGTLLPEPDQPAARHTLRQLGYITQETLAIHQQRLATNRGNGYLRPLDLVLAEGDAGRNIGWPSFDCDNTGDGERVPGDGGSPEVGVSPGPLPGTVTNYASCWIDRDYPDRFGGSRAPNLEADE